MGMPPFPPKGKGGLTPRFLSPPSPRGGLGEESWTREQASLHPPKHIVVLTLIKLTFSMGLGGTPLEATQQPTPSRVTTVPWKQIGFKIFFLLTNLLVKLESTTFVVGKGSPQYSKRGLEDDWH